MPGLAMPAAIASRPNAGVQGSCSSGLVFLSWHPNRAPGAGARGVLVVGAPGPEHVGITSLERKSRDLRGGCCIWEIRDTTALRVALGAVVVKSAVNAAFNLDTSRVAATLANNITMPRLAIAMPAAMASQANAG